MIPYEILKAIDKQHCKSDHQSFLDASKCLPISSPYWKLSSFHWLPQRQLQYSFPPITNEQTNKQKKPHTQKKNKAQTNLTGKGCVVLTHFNKDSTLILISVSSFKFTLPTQNICCRLISCVPFEYEKHFGQ